PTERDIDFGFLQEHFTPKSDRLAIALAQAGYEATRCARPFRQVRTIKAKKNGINTDLVSYMKWQNKRPTHNTHPKTRPYALAHDAALPETYDTVSRVGRTFKVPSPLEPYLHRECDDWRPPREDSVSRTRAYDFMKEQAVPESLIDSPCFKCS